MGMSPEAHIGFGVPLWDSDDDPDWIPEDAEDPAGWVEKKLLASVGFTETDWRADGYFQRRREAERKVGVKVEYGGTWDYTTYILVVADSHVENEWGQVTEVKAQHEDHLHACKLIADALKALGAPAQEPAWLLWAFYG